MLHPQCRCGAQKLLSVSPAPEEPTNLCQSNSVIDPAPSSVALTQLPNCDDEEEQESMKYRIDKASSGAASAELGMPAYEPCSPKMDYETQDEMPDSPHSQHQQQLEQLPPPSIALPPPPTHQLQHHHQHDEEQQQLLQERIQHEFMLQQQHQHQHLQQQHLQQQQQQHLALLQQQQQEAAQQQQQQHQHQHQQLPQQQQGVNMAITATGTNNIRRKSNLKRFFFSF